MAFSFNSDGIQWSSSEGGGGGGTEGGVTPNGKQTLTNKTIDADNNNVVNLSVDNFKKDVVRDSVRVNGDAADSNLVTEKAVARALSTFIFEQALASNTWVVVHNLNRYPSIFTVDSAGTQFLTEVHYDSPNQLTISLNGATTGKAYLN